jgi:hypothetical protein
MKQYNIPLEEVRVHASLVKELYQMNKKISERIHFLSWEQQEIGYY